MPDKKTKKYNNIEEANENQVWSISDLSKSAR
jgi:hypothetical protein